MGELLTKFEPGGRVLKSEALLIPPHHSTETLECGVGENVKPFLWGAILLRRRSRLRRGHFVWYEPIPRYIKVGYDTSIYFEFLPAKSRSRFLF